MSRARGQRRLRDLFLVACAVLGVLSLPHHLFHPLWLVAFIVPAIVFFVLRCKTGSGVVRSLLVAGIVQLAAIIAVAEQIGPLSRLTGLGCTLLPPLAFMVARRHSSDVLRALFLSFCLFLIGTILGDPSGIECIAFLCCAAMALQTDVAVRNLAARYSWQGRAEGTVSRLRSLTSVAAAALVICLGCFQLLQVLPAPGVEQSQGRSSGSRRGGQVGLSSEFEFDTAPGSPLNMQADELVRVRARDRRPVPHDLYLRCSYFDVPGLDKWRTASPAEGMRRARRGYMQVRRPHADARTRSLSVEIVEPSSTFLFVPPGTLQILRARGLVGAPRSEMFRLAEVPDPGDVYGVDYQDLRGFASQALPAEGTQRLTAIGSDLRPWLFVFDRLLRQPPVQRELMPIALARALTRIIQARCSYALREPTGPYEHSVLNFLEGDQVGFCMHYASTLAICLRLAGVPCRIGAGLYGGTELEEDRGSRTFGSQHAHAWVEIPLEGLGWVVFDPSPPLAPGSEGRRWPEPEFAAVDVGETEVDQADGTSSAQRAIDLLARPARHPGFWATLLLVGLITTFLRRGKIVAPAHARRVPPQVVTARRILEKILVRLARRGHPRFRDQSLEAYLAGLRGDTGLPYGELESAFACYQETRFGGRPFDDTRRHGMERALQRLR